MPGTGVGDTIANISASQSILKELYGGVNMIAQQRRKSYDLFTKSKRPIKGKRWFTAEHFEGGSGAAGSRPDGVELPPVKAEIYGNAQVYDRYHYAGIGYTGPAMRHATGDVASFVNLITSEIQNKTNWLIDLLNIQTYMDGWGIICQTNAARSGGGNDQMVVKNLPNNLWIRKGMRFDIYASDGATTGFKREAAPVKRNTAGTRGGYEVKSWDPTTSTITFTTAIDAAIDADDDIVFEDIAGGAGTSAGGGGGKIGAGANKTVTAEGTGLSGLAVMVDDTTTAIGYQSIDRQSTGFPEYRASVLNNGGLGNRAITLDLLQSAMDRALIAAGGGQNPGIDTVISGLGQRRNLINLALPDVRFDAETVKLGYKNSITFNGHEWVVDEIAPSGKAWMLQRTGNIWKYESLPLGPLDDDEAPTRMRIRGFDQYEMYLAAYFNLGVDRPNANTLITDLTEPT